MGVGNTIHNPPDKWHLVKQSAMTSQRQIRIDQPTTMLR